MSFKEFTKKGIALLAIAAFAAAPISAPAQSHRQKTKNEWRNLAIGSGVLGLLGLVNGDKTLTFLGTAGALYSANRYEQDRKSQRREERARYELFRRGSFNRDGHHYVRKTVWKNHHKYYRFVRAW
ncbi:MAG TPA: hypothetical protein VG820_01085 [Fimbriimonadaceae bacterium]|nr:hypothetical protein [Fimbriimonadaceae bacterium]